jgi:hypothetical protein
MKNKGIIIFLIVLAVVIVAVMMNDFLSDRPDKRDENPYEYNVDEFKEVAPELIFYKEAKNFKIGFEKPAGIDIRNDSIFLVGDKSLKIVDCNGVLINEISLPDQPQTVESAEGLIYVAFEKQVLVYFSDGTLLREWETLHENSLITAISAFGENVFVADAGMRKVYHFSKEGELLNEFEGKSGDDVLHGFIVPSPYFDLDINPDGDLWVVNPGKHALENYTFGGNLRSHWENTGINIEGFSGCCNPAHFTFLSDGSFVTSEKGMVRLKIYRPSGEFSGVVAAPNQFKDEGEAPDVAVDNAGNIYALDFDRKILRVFEPK